MPHLFFRGSIGTGFRVLKYDRQFGGDSPYRSDLGVFLDDPVIQCWGHRLSVDWDFGASAPRSAAPSSLRTKTRTRPPTKTRMPGCRRAG